VAWRAVLWHRHEPSSAFSGDASPRYPGGQHDMSLAPTAESAGTPRAAPPVPRRAWLTGTDLTGYLFISPWVFGFLVFTLFPFVASLLISMTNWQVVGDWQFIGLGNYEKMLSGRDNIFVESVKVTFIYSFARVPLIQIIAIGLALLLNQPIQGRAFFRTIFYLPAVTAGVATAYLWSFIFSNRGGLVNTIMGVFGIEGPNWLYSLEWSLPALIIISCWNVGTSMLIYLAALQGVPESLHEAAMIDGAGILARFRHITVPMITPAIFFNMVLGVIGSFQGFTDALIITNGGPGYSTLLYLLYLYQSAFRDGLMGYASALAWFLFLILMVFTLLQLVLSRRWVYYEGESPDQKRGA
jgi:multiple sugar transport system permease protein